MTGAVAVGVRSREGEAQPGAPVEVMEANEAMGEVPAQYKYRSQAQDWNRGVVADVQRYSHPTFS